MGMSSEEFWQMRLKEFFLKLQAFSKAKEADQRREADLVRMQTVELLNIQLAENDKMKDPKELWVFSWEEEDSTEAKDKLVTEEVAVQGAKNLSKLL